MSQAHDKVIVDANGDILTKENSGSLASKKTGDELARASSKLSVGERNVYVFFHAYNKLVGFTNKFTVCGVHIGR